MRQSLNLEGKERQQQKEEQPQEEYHTVEIIRVPSIEGGSYTPLWMNDIPETIQDFQRKEKTWIGFKYALKNIGLDVDEVRKRLFKGKTPWQDEEQQKINCQKAWMRYKQGLKLVSSHSTTQPKSKASRPEEGSWRENKQSHERTVKLKGFMFKKPCIYIYKSRYEYMYIYICVYKNKNNCNQKYIHLYICIYIYIYIMSEK